MRNQDKMDVFDERTIHSAIDARERAERLAGASWWRQRRGGTLSVLPRWTAWLLMRRAGIPVALIADVYKRDACHVRRCVNAAAALMMWPPYAARIEALMTNMPRFAALEPPVPKPTKEAACAVQAG